MIGILIGCLTLVVVGWAIVKGKYAPLVLFASGAFMLACAVFFDTGTFMPKKALPTGNDYLNIIEFIRYMFSNRLAGLGFLIMTMVGFASYMTHIGANDAFVNIAIKPLSIIRNPYILIFVAFMLGKAVSMVITSAVGLGVLCLALMGPALAALGINKKAIGAVFVTSGACSAARRPPPPRPATCRFSTTSSSSRFRPVFRPCSPSASRTSSGSAGLTVAKAGTARSTKARRSSSPRT